jgi:phage tail-like protein
MTSEDKHSREFLGKYSIKGGTEMKRAMYVVLAVLIILGAQIYSPPSGESAAAQKEAPITGSFTASIDVQGAVVGYLAAVKGIGNENEVIEHKTVDKMGELVMKVPGRFKVTDIVIRMNATPDKFDFYNWRMSFLQRGAKEKKNGSIVFYDATLKPIVQYNFINAWPSQYRGITMDPQSPYMGFVEELVLTVEGIARVKVGTPPR